MSAQNNGVGATPSVAFFHSSDVLCGDDALFLAILDNHMKIAYLYDSDFGTEDVDFGSIPEFDLVAADLAGADRQTYQLALLFIRARSPVSFVLAGDQGSGFPWSAIQWKDGPGYEVRTTKSGNRVFVVGTLSGESFEWPPGMVPS